MYTILYYTKILSWYIPVLAWKLGYHSVMRASRLLFQLWWFVLSRKLTKKRKIFELGVLVNTIKHKLFLEKAMDIAVLAEVYVLNEYDWHLPYEPRTVLDLGAHWGDSSIFYVTKYPNARVFALEPNKESYLRLQKHAAQFTNLLPFQISLGNSDGHQTMYVSEDTLGNSVKKREVSADSYEVESYTLPSLAKKFGIECFDLIKFDIEGAEEFIFKDEKAKDYSKAFIGELHFDLMDITMEDVKSYFSGFKMQFRRISQQRYIVKAIKIL